MSETIFDKILSGEIESTEVYSDEHIYAFEDISPQAPVHVLVIPRRRIVNIGEMEESDVELMGRLFLGAKKVAEKKGLDDFRVVMNSGADAGQSVFHAHLHVIGGRDLSWPPG